MNGLPETVVVWVENTRRLHTYTLVTEGSAEDIGMAYDVARLPLDKKPTDSGVDGVEFKVVRDLVELDEQVRSALGLTRVTTKLVIQNALWRGFGSAAKAIGDGARKVGVPVPAVTGGAKRVPTSAREYRVGHPKYAG